VQFHEDAIELKSDSERVLKRRDAVVATYFDPRGRTRDGFSSLGGWSGYPTTLLLDRSGIIREVWVGDLPGATQQMESRLQLLLAS
jgi:hypothetical protein